MDFLSYTIMLKLVIKVNCKHQFIKNIIFGKEYYFSFEQLLNNFFLLLNQVLLILKLKK